MVLLGLGFLGMAALRRYKKQPNLVILTTKKGRTIDVSAFFIARPAGRTMEVTQRWEILCRLVQGSCRSDDKG
jgi:hypothetical protein